LNYADSDHNVNSLALQLMPRISKAGQTISEIEGKELRLHNANWPTLAFTPAQISEGNYNTVAEIDGKELPLPSPQEMDSSQQPSIRVTSATPIHNHPTTQGTYALDEYYTYASKHDRSPHDTQGEEDVTVPRVAKEGETPHVPSEQLTRYALYDPPWYEPESQSTNEGLER
jgi:hypothetical protein